MHVRYVREYFTLRYKGWSGHCSIPRVIDSFRVDEREMLPEPTEQRASSADVQPRYSGLPSLLRRLSHREWPPAVYVERQTFLQWHDFWTCF